MLMSHLAAELSHDMAVPLTSIVACLEMLEDELGEHRAPEVEALLARARRAADQMLRMLDQHMEIDEATAERVVPDVDPGRVALQLAVDSADLLELTDAGSVVP